MNRFYLLFFICFFVAPSFLFAQSSLIKIVPKKISKDTINGSIRITIAKEKIKLKKLEKNIAKCEKEAKVKAKNDILDNHSTIKSVLESSVEESTYNRNSNYLENFKQVITQTSIIKNLELQLNDSICKKEPILYTNRANLSCTFNYSYQCENINDKQYLYSNIYYNSLPSLGISYNNFHVPVNKEVKKFSIKSGSYKFEFIQGCFCTTDTALVIENGYDYSISTILSQSCRPVKIVVDKNDVIININTNDVNDRQQIKTFKDAQNVSKYIDLFKKGKQYKITIQKDGFETIDTSFFSGTNNDTLCFAYSLKPKNINLRVSANPDNAQILFNHKPVGSNQIEIEIADSVLLEVVKDGYYPYYEFLHCKTIPLFKAVNLVPVDYTELINKFNSRLIEYTPNTDISISKNGKLKIENEDSTLSFNINQTQIGLDNIKRIKLINIDTCLNVKKKKKKNPVYLQSPQPEKLFSLLTEIQYVFSNFYPEYNPITKFKEINESFQNMLSFSEGKAPVKINGKWGFINLYGDIIIEPKFDSVMNFSESLAGVKVNHKWGFVDNNGKTVILPQFKEIKSFSNGLAGVKFRKSWEFITKSYKSECEKSISDTTTVLDWQEQNCGLSYIPDKVFHLKNLKHLSLQNNNLFSLQKEIGSLTKLECLNLISNNITILPAEIGKLKHLKVLQLMNNKIKSIPFEIGELYDLEILDLRINLLDDSTIFPESISRLPKLKKLLLDSSKFSVNKKNSIKVIFKNKVEFDSNT